MTGLAWLRQTFGLIGKDPITASGSSVDLPTVRFLRSLGQANFDDAWHYAPWAPLTVLETRTLADGAYPKAGAHELGQIIGLWTADYRADATSRPIQWRDQAATFVALPPFADLATVWVEAWRVPTVIKDPAGLAQAVALNTLDEDEFLVCELPESFADELALLAAGQYANALIPEKPTLGPMLLNLAKQGADLKAVSCWAARQRLACIR